MFRSNCPLKPHLNPQSALSLSEQNQPCNGSSCVHNEQGLLSSFLAPAANQRPIGRARTFPTPRVSSSPAIIRCAEGGRERGAAAVESNAQTEVCHPRPNTLASKPADLTSLQAFYLLSAQTDTEQCLLHSVAMPSRSICPRHLT